MMVAIVGILLAFASYYLYVTNIFEISKAGYKLLASLMISIPFFPIFFFYYEPVYAILTSVITTAIAYCILWGIMHFKWIFTKEPVNKFSTQPLYMSYAEFYSSHLCLLHQLSFSLKFSQLRHHC